MSRDGWVCGNCGDHSTADERPEHCAGCGVVDEMVSGVYCLQCAVDGVDRMTYASHGSELCGDCGEELDREEARLERAREIAEEHRVERHLDRLRGLE